MLFTIFVFHNTIELIEAVVHTNASTKSPGMDLRIAL